MMNSNKILTVSYGTFSCTLEGFDDSFGTMKAIAEYFRDLASDDRYFGAEPPQPDAEMLARIAQREVSRRVQAREQEGKIVLSALEDQSPRSAPEPTPAPEAQVPPATQPEVKTSEVEAPLQAGIADTAAVTAAAAAPLAEAGPPAPEVPAAVAETAAPEAPKPEAPEVDTTEAAAFFADSAPAQDSYEDEAPAPVAEDLPAAEPAPADSIAAKLQRIRAVVARQDEDEEDGYDDEEFPAPASAPSLSASLNDEDDSADEDNAVASARRDIEEALEADDAADAAEASESEEEIDDLTDILSRLEQGEHPAETAATSAEPTERDTAAAEDNRPAPRGRVIKVRRADLTAAIARGDIEEETDAPAADAPRSSTLSAEEEDELARELAALEAELGGDALDAQSTTEDEDLTEDEPAEEAQTQEASAEDEADDEETAEVAPAARPENTRSARRVLPTIDDETNPDMSRLMAETDSKMGEPDSATNRDAFAHLRAAVAAKKADEAMGGRGTLPTSDDAYREDLADVVRPRRPTAPNLRTERPAGDARPAPLKLVAEQRIDTEQPRPAGPVRPRRVAAVVEPTPTNPDAESFAEFAADMGATKLPELLEAAAAYMSFVEGRDQFSRPQLMGKVRQVQREDFTREDGLRSFGQLLRAGKIEKIKGGRFTVSEDIGYRPDHRAAG